MSNIDNLSVSFGADFRGLIAEMKKAEGATAQFRQKAEREMANAKAAFDRIGSQIRSGIASAISTIGITRIAQLSREALRLAENIEKQSAALGVGVEYYQALQYAARQAGVDQNALLSGATRLREVMAEAAAGKGEGLPIFKAMGIQLRDLNGQLKTVEAVLPELADKFAKLGPGDQQLVGKLVGQDFAKLLNLGGDAIERLLAQAKEFNQVWGAGMVSKNAALNKEIDNLQSRIGKDLTAAAGDFAGAWLVALKAIVKIQEGADGLLSSLRIGGQRVGKDVTPDQRRAELDRDMAEAQRKIDAAAAAPRRSLFGIANDRGKTDIAALQADIDRMREERRGLDEFDRIQKRDRSGTPPAPGAGKRDTGLGVATASESELARKLKEIADAARDARNELTMDPADAAWAKMEADLTRLGAQLPQLQAAGENFTSTWRDQAGKAFKELQADQELQLKLVQAEAMGRKDVVLALQMQSAFAKQFGVEEAQRLASQFEAMAKIRVEAERQAELMQELRSTVQDALVSGFQDAAAALQEFAATGKIVWSRFGEIALNTLQKISNKLAEMALNQLFQKLLGTIIGSVGNIAGAAGGIGGGGMGASSGIGALFGGPRAEGGPVLPGMAYLVGEKRPEIFMPDQPGRIIPRVPESGMGAVYNIDARGADREGLARLEAMIRRTNGRLNHVDASIGPRAVSAVVDAKRRGGAVANTFGR